MEMRFVTDHIRYQRMNTEELRQEFLIDSLFQPGRIDLVYSEIDRAVIGSAVPGDKPQELPCPDQLRAEYFCQRRELGIINIGQSGTVIVDGERYSMPNRHCLYIGRGSKTVGFESAQPEQPAAFYLLSYPAHTSYPTAHATPDDATQKHLGNPENCNERSLYQYIHPDGLKSCQLMMGFTEVPKGSNWNTMPCHAHPRRSEVYLYFDMPEKQLVFHLFGKPDQTRHLVVRDRQVVVSPMWSIHSGVGTAPYCFVWGMGGENQRFDDMDPVDLDTMR